MAKVIRCKDAGYDCAEVVHNTQVTPEMAQQIRGLIKEE